MATVSDAIRSAGRRSAQVGPFRWAGQLLPGGATEEGGGCRCGRAHPAAGDPHRQHGVLVEAGASTRSEDRRSPAARCACHRSGRGGAGAGCLGQRQHRAGNASARHDPVTTDVPPGAADCARVRGWRGKASHATIINSARAAVRSFNRCPGSERQRHAEDGRWISRAGRGVAPVRHPASGGAGRRRLHEATDQRAWQVERCGTSARSNRSTPLL